VTRSRRRRVWVFVWVFSLLSIGLSAVLYALSDNINVYVTPTQYIQMLAEGKNHSFELGGMVEAGSVHRGEGLAIEFNVTDYNNSVNVSYNGILPDLFREGQGVIVLGKPLPTGGLLATRLLAKHDENYRPPLISGVANVSEGADER
jgi:cytochrome c-type biogenesis protein CcmE